MKSHELDKIAVPGVATSAFRPVQPLVDSIKITEAPPDDPTHLGSFIRDPHIELRITSVNVLDA